jgi:hypothetical protein
MKKIILFTIIGLGLMFTSCRKDRIEPTVPTTMEKLAVPSNFNWKTTKDYQITLTGYTNGIAEVSNLSGTPYLKAYLATNQAYTTKLTVPTYEKQINIKFMGKTVKIDLGATAINYNFTTP